MFFHSISNPLHEQAQTKTVKQRSATINSIRKDIRVDPEYQLQSELKGLSKSAREDLLKSELTEVTAEQSVAMKADLGIPWNELRTMRSERRMRQRVNDMRGESNLLCSEACLFSFACKSGGEEMRTAPLVYIPHLTAKVVEFLDKYDRLDKLTWNDHIPEDEIWVKIGGDKGGSSFKMNFQVMNLENPNSIQNTCVFAAFQASDSPFNLHICMDRYSDQIDELQRTEWKGKMIRVFLSGDYEFLCHMYGLSGPSGKHCCLWCLSTKPEFQLGASTISLRTTDSIYDDHEKFLMSGGDIKKVKNFNNAVRRPFFKIQLLQVCLHGLHISLGLFHRLFTLLEEECQTLDRAMSGVTDVSMDGTSEPYKEYTSATQQLLALKEEYQKAEEAATAAEQLHTFLSLTVNEQQLTAVKELALYNRHMMAELEKRIKQEEKKTETL